MTTTIAPTPTTARVLTDTLFGGIRSTEAGYAASAANLRRFTEALERFDNPPAVMDRDQARIWRACHRPEDRARLLRKIELAQAQMASDLERIERIRKELEQC